MVLPPDSLEAPVCRPFALLALAATLGVATPIGAITLYRLFAAPGPVPSAWPRLHAHLQIFGFAGVSLHAGFLRLVAFSGFLAWATLFLWGLAVGRTMIRGAAIRR